MKRTATRLAAIGGLMLLGATEASADTIFDVAIAKVSMMTLQIEIGVRDRVTVMIATSPTAALLQVSRIFVRKSHAA